MPKHSNQTSFKPGNDFGSKPHRRGRKPKEINILHAELFSAKNVTMAHKKLMKLVEKGDLDAIKYVIDRTCGRPKVAIAIEDGGLDLAGKIWRVGEARIKGILKEAAEGGEGAANAS